MTERHLTALLPHSESIWKISDIRTAKCIITAVVICIFDLQYYIKLQ